MKNKIAVIESQFLLKYDEPEKGITVGGTQRYAFQLGRLLKEQGYNIFFLTKACRSYEGKFEDIGVIKAIVAKNGTRGNKTFSKKVYEFCKNCNADLVCYSDLQIGYFYCYPNSFAIQHGIDWDGPSDKFKTIIQNFMYIRAARKFKKIICVDTNYINWCRIRDKSVFNNTKRMTYIPNFADEDMFLYKYKQWEANDEPYVLLYARRLVSHRGYEIFLDMCEILYNKGYNIKPILAFEDFAEEQLKSLTEKYSCHFEVVHPKMNEINQLYYEAFISYVPTRWSEGTSLSAIESLCTGCPIIVSDVGGLANIVIKGFNGDIVEPDVDSFVRATEKILKNPDIRNKWAKNCKEMRFAFGVKRWNDQVLEVIKEISEN